MSILNGIKLLDSLSDLEKENLALFCQEKQLSAWEVLFNEEEEASAMYILKEWNIQISRISGWKNIILWDVHSEEILSIKELTNSHPELMDKIKTIINDRMMSNKNINK